MFILAFFIFFFDGVSLSVVVFFFFFSFVYFFMEPLNVALIQYCNIQTHDGVCGVGRKH